MLYNARITESTNKGSQDMKPATKIAMILLTLVALAHLWRLVMGVPVVIGGDVAALSDLVGGGAVGRGGWVVPMWVSVLGAIVPGGLAFMMYKENS